MGDCDELVCFFVYLNCVEWFVLDGLECDVTNNVELYMCACVYFNLSLRCDCQV
jgi:hypothetical protein